MKKLFFVICLITISTVLYSQSLTEGSFDCLKNEQKISFQYDLKDAVIKGFSYEDYINYEPKWERGFYEVTMKFISEANTALNGKFILTYTKDCNYTLTFKVTDVDNKGTTYGDLILTDKEGNQVASVQNLYAKGGHFGSHLNLMGDAAKRAGVYTAEFLLYQLSE